MLQPGANGSDDGRLFSEQCLIMLYTPAAVRFSSVHVLSTEFNVLRIHGSNNGDSTWVQYTINHQCMEISYNTLPLVQNDYYAGNGNGIGFLL